MGRLQRGRARRDAERDSQRTGLMFWLRLVVVFLIIAFLITQVLRLLGQSEWRESELDTAIYRFGQTAMLANSEWHRIGRSSPVQVRVGQGSETKNLELHLNPQGWPLPYSPELMPRSMNAHGCMALWQQLAQAPDVTKQGLSASWQNEQGLCVYRFNNRDIFSYRLRNGHVRML
ncbi:MAG: hypothetical protein JJU03_03860 [Idiomarina sp.]|nr:hypothetical protein [Idiomarina sp.]